MRYTYTINEHTHGDMAGWAMSVTLTDYGAMQSQREWRPLLAAVILEHAGQLDDAERIRSELVGHPDYLEMTLTDANDRAAAYGYLLVDNMALGNRNHHPIAIVDVKSSVLVACEKSPRLALDWIAEQLDYLGEEHDLD